MAQVDIHHPPSGGFQNGNWYWDPSIKEARQFWNGGFGAGTTINNPNQQGYGQRVSDAVQKQSGYVAPNSGSSPIGQSSSNAQSGSPLQQVNQAIQDSASKLMTEVQSKWGQYTAGNPFRVDQVLADKTKEAKEQIDPYYNQLLGDYMLGVTRKINRSTDDRNDLLSELTSTTANQNEASQDALQHTIETEQAKYATHGLINSGEALASTGESTANTNSGIALNNLQSDAKAKQISNTAQRDIEDTNAGATDFATQNAQQQYTAEQQRAADLTKTAGQQYVAGFQATLPPELQSAGGFDMLKSLGIYG